MGFLSGTITGNPNPAAAMVAVMRTGLDANGWQFVEEYTDTNSSVYTVYRNPAANSGLAADFFIVLTRAALGGTSVGVWLAEGYSAATRTLSKMAVNPDLSTPQTPASDGTCSATYTLGTPNFGGSTTPNMVAAVALGSPYGTFDYWLLITKDGVTLSTRVGTQPTALQVGVYETFVVNAAVNDPMPLVLVGFAASGYQYQQYPASSATRMPMRGGLSTHYAWGLLPFTRNDQIAWTYPAVYMTNTAGGDLYQGGAALASRIVCGNLSLAYSTTEVPSTGGIRGLYKNLLLIGMGSGAAQGDTIVVGGRTYVLAHNTLPIWIDTQGS